MACPLLPKGYPDSPICPPRALSAPKMTDLYRRLSMSTWEQSVNSSEAALRDEPPGGCEPGLWFQVWSSVLRVWGLGFEIWGLGFGDSGFGLGVLNF